MSIQGFSQPSTDLALWSADDKHKGHEVRGFLSSRDIWFIPCLGAYRMESGAKVTEMSYLTSWAGFLTMAPLFCEGQESVLRLGSMDSLSRRKATLIYNRPDGAWDHGAPVDLGRLYSIPAADADQHDAWTIPLQQPAGCLNAFVCGTPDKFGQMQAPIVVPAGWNYV